jgi:tetratricopeptide (TPR) repeat protein
MPGSDMGSGASWDSPDQIRRHLYEPICTEVEAQLGRTVELVIEKDKSLSGPIYSSMYSEAWTADVYLADLTGANANVYLELGVRWAMSDGVTVLLAQDPSKLEFNVAATRAMPYSNDHDALKTSIRRIVTSIVEGLKAKSAGGSDSPVRENAKVKSVSSSELEALHADLKRLRDERGEGYLEAAADATDLETKISLLRRAVEVNPLVAASRFELGWALRQSGSADSTALEELEVATHLSPNSAPYWREFGIALSKSGQTDAGVRALQRSVELDGTDFVAVSALAGAQRRLALEGAPTNTDWDLLLVARGLYGRAVRLSPRDSYPLLNIARIDLMLGGHDPEARSRAQVAFRKAQPLCEFELEEALEAADGSGTSLTEWEMVGYRAFDYADCVLFSGQVSEGRAAYLRAIDLVPKSLRSDIFRSVLTGMRGLAELAELGEEPGQVVEEVQALLSDA